MDGTSKQARETSPSLADEVFAGGGEMGALMRSIDWSATPLGAVERWPQSLRTAVSICLASYFPMLIWWGPELVKLYNDAYRTILGATKHPRAMGQRGKECWPEIWHIIGPMLEGVLKEGKATWSENQLLLLERNGYAEECYFTFSYSPIRDESGGVGGVFTAVTETTSHVLGERRLRTLREVASSAYDAKTAVDACRLATETLAKNSEDIPFALLYLLENDGKQARLAGQSGSPLDGTACPERVDIASSDESSQAWPIAQVIRDGQPIAVTDVIHRFGPILVHSPTEAVVHTALVLPIARPGQAEPYGLLIAGTSPLRALDDEYAGFLALVAGQVAGAVANALAYSEARRQAEELAELDRAKTAFFSNVSHEFRTPLTLLLGPIDDALSDTQHPLQEQHRAQLEIVRRNALRLLKLVNTLLDFSRIEAGRALAVYEPTDLAIFTNDLASTFREVIERAGLRFVVDCPPLPEAIFVDRDMWEKIVLNLLSNAFKFTLRGQITITQRFIDDHVELVVQDTGTGIAEEELPHIFERFYRAHHTEARTQEGSGIGLSLVSELVRLHSGTVRVSSQEGKGTTFTVSIPGGPEHLLVERRATRKLFPSATESAAYIEEALRWLPSETPESAQTEAKAYVHDTTGENAEKGASAKKMPAGRILLADDNADMRDYLGRLLSAYWQVEAVANGTDALRTIEQNIPDLVISDVMMPGLDGFQLLSALRSDPRSRDIPIILLSARAGEESTIEGLEAGADDYLVKPFSTRELLARVSTHMELALMRRAIVTQIQQHADETARLYQQAQEAVSLRDDLLAVVSHDLKNPLTTVMGFTQLLRGNVGRTNWPEKDSILDGISRIYSTATRMNTLIDELLDIAHVQIGKPLDLDTSETDLVRLARQDITAYEQTSRHHQFHFEASIPELIGWWDSARLHRVLGNLLSNAIKYSPEGGAITVTVSREEIGDSSWAILSVADKGIGIPASDLPQIFDRFHRAKNVIKQIKGSGIGLASARHIIEQHGGSISVASQEGAGSTFTIRLPLNLQQ